MKLNVAYLRGPAPVEMLWQKSKNDPGIVTPLSNTYAGLDLISHSNSGI